MSLLLDLSDDRRAAKTWLPASDKDVTEGRVVKGSIVDDGRPLCATHGAMNCIALVDDGSRLFRCSECAVGAQWYPTNSREAKSRFRQEWDARVTGS
jgi:hypothetical protein